MEKLSDDTLEHIFQYLDKSSLISALFTCQRLQDFVICSGLMMKQLPVTMNARNGSNSSLQTVLATSEKIRDLQLYGNVNLDRFHHSSESIRNLSFFNLNTFSYHQNQVNVILNTMSHLETLNIYSPPFNGTTLQEDVILIPKLIKNLNINYYHIKSLSGHVQAQKLTINFSNADSSVLAPVDVTSFILQQTELKSLVLTDLNLNSYALFPSDISKLVEFKLQELELIRCYIESFENTNHELFLKANTQLKHITLSGSQVSNICNIIPETFLQLDSVDINSSSINSYGEQIPNLSVKKLQLRGYFDTSTCKTTLKRFPAITELRQIGHIVFSNYILAVISSTCPELTLLEIGILTTRELYNDAVYGNLKTLEIDLVNFEGSGIETWNTFLKMFPVLQNITIRKTTNSSHFPKEFLELLLDKISTLHCLNLGGTLAELQMLQSTAENPRNLKMIKFQKNVNIPNLKELQQKFQHNKSVSLYVADFDVHQKWSSLKIN